MITDVVLRIRHEAFDVCCGACGTRAHLTSDTALYAWISAHHDPRLSAAYFRTNGGPVQKWTPRHRPPSLRSHP